MRMLLRPHFQGVATTHRVLPNLIELPPPEQTSKLLLNHTNYAKFNKNYLDSEGCNGAPRRLKIILHMKYWAVLI